MIVRLLNGIFKIKKEERSSRTLFFILFLMSWVGRNIAYFGFCLVKVRRIISVLSVSQLVIGYTPNQVLTRRLRVFIKAKTTHGVVSKGRRKEKGEIVHVQERNCAKSKEFLFLFRRGVSHWVRVVACLFTQARVYIRDTRQRQPGLGCFALFFWNEPWRIDGGRRISGSLRHCPVIFFIGVCLFVCFMF